MNFIGTASKNPEYRTVSILEPTEKFMKEFLTLDDVRQIEQDYLDAVEGVILRDVDKIAMNYIKTEDL